MSDISLTLHPLVPENARGNPDLISRIRRDGISVTIEEEAIHVDPPTTKDLPPYLRPMSRYHRRYLHLASRDSGDGAHRLLPPLWVLAHAFNDDTKQSLFQCGSRFISSTVREIVRVYDPESYELERPRSLMGAVDWYDKPSAPNKNDMVNVYHQVLPGDWGGYATNYNGQVCADTDNYGMVIPVPLSEWPMYASLDLRKNVDLGKLLEHKSAIQALFLTDAQHFVNMLGIAQRQYNGHHRYFFEAFNLAVAPISLGVAGTAFAVQMGESGLEVAHAASFSPVVD